MTPKVVRCDLLIVDPPFGITDEPWEPEDIETFTRDWCRRWAGCSADFVAIFWCQDEAVGRTEVVRPVAQGLRVSADAHLARQQSVRTQEPDTLKQSWYPIFIYRRRGSGRKVITDDKTWDREPPVLDCHVSRRPANLRTGVKTSVSTPARNR